MRVCTCTTCPPHEDLCPDCVTLAEPQRLQCGQWVAVSGCWTPRASLH